MSTNPIKRSKALLRFSQEHHYGLLLVWKIKEGLKYHISAERIADFTLFFYDNDLKHHFEKEETDLFEKLQNNSTHYSKTLEEHEQLTSLIEKIRLNKKNSSLLNDFSELLEKHIRFEEREVFKFLENEFSEKDLFDIAQKHEQKPIDISQNWNDKFWILKK